MPLLSALVLAVVVLFLPGVVLLRAVGALGWFDAIALAAPISTGVCVVVGLVPSWLGGFRLLTWVVVVGAGAAVTLAFAARRRGRPVAPAATEPPAEPSEPPTEPPAEPPVREASGTAWLGAGIGALVAGWLWWPAIWPVQAVPQNYDFDWHAYTTAVVAHLHLGNPFAMVPTDPLIPAVHDFYPIGFHLVAALAASAGGGPTGVAASLNAVQFLLAVLVVPLGVAALVRELLPRHPVAVLIAPALVTLAPSWQARVVGLPPYAETMAFLPAVVTALLMLSRRGWDVRLGAVTLLAPMALDAVQPAGAITTALVAACAVTERWLRGSPRPGLSRPGLSRARELGRAGVWLGAAAVLTAPWALASTVKASGTFGTSRAAYTRLPHALVALVQLDWAAHPVPLEPLFLPVAAAAGLGLGWLALANRAVWPLLACALFGGLFVIAAGYPGRARRVLTAVWFNDWYRLMPVVVLLAALGLAAFAAALLRPAGPVRRGAAGLVVALLVVAWAGHQATAARRLVSDSRAPTVVTPGDVAAFAWLAHAVHPGERVLNDWVDGSGWMYATRGVVPLVPFISTLTTFPDRAQLIRDFGVDDGDAAGAAALRERLKAYGIRYVMVSTTRLPGLAASLRLPAADRGLRLVFARDDAAVYELT